MPSKVVCCYPNNKPWITSSLKALLNEKKKAFRRGDSNRIKELQRELKVKIREVKKAYGLKLEQQLQQDGVKQGRAGLKQKCVPLSGQLTINAYSSSSFPPPTVLLAFSNTSDMLCADLHRAFHSSPHL